MKIEVLKKSSSILNTIYLPLIVVVINLLIILFPKESIWAAKEGLGLWFENVLPSLLPFLIGTNLLMSLGFVNFLGVMLEPIMRPLFGVPGCGGFALAVGILSGYPMGAKITAGLIERGEITKHEGQRLLSFVNNSGPLFVLGAVSAGMFGSVYVGYFMLAVHYSAAVSTGILFRLLYNSNPFARGRRKKNPLEPKYEIGGESRLFMRAYRSMAESKNRDIRPFGAKLGDSVVKSIETVVQIGGFIMFFCVIIKILDLTNIFYVLESRIAPLGARVGLPDEIYKGLLTGIVEITNGVKLLSENGLTAHSIIASVVIISWGGFSIHAQSLSFLSKTDISPSVYLTSKFINSMFAIAYGILLYPLFAANINVVEAAAVAKIYKAGILDKFLSSAAYFALTIATVSAAGAGVVLTRKITHSFPIRRSSPKNQL